MDETPYFDFCDDKNVSVLECKRHFTIGAKTVDEGRRMFRSVTNKSLQGLLSKIDRIDMSSVKIQHVRNERLNRAFADR